MERVETGIPGVVLLEPRVFRDPRGHFFEFYNRRTFESFGIDASFVQDNHSRSGRGVLRGMHYQIQSPQDKLVRVTQGAVFDVAVDIRRGSPAFGRWVGFELSADNFRMLFVPAGCAHGFLVLSEVAEFQYKCSDFYCPSGERGIAWDDPDVAIGWPISDRPPLLSDKDRACPRLADVAPGELPVYTPEEGTP